MNLFLPLASLKAGQFRYLPQCFGLGSRVTHKCAKGRETNAINWMTKVKEESRKNGRKWWTLDWDAEWSGKYSCDGNPREDSAKGARGKDDREKMGREDVGIRSSIHGWRRGNGGSKLRWDEVLRGEIRLRRKSDFLDCDSVRVSVGLAHIHRPAELGIASI